MRRFVSGSTVVITFLLAAVANVNAVEAQVSSSEEEAIVALLESVSAAMQSGDLATLDSVYAGGPGVHIIEGAGVNHGWADYRDHHVAPELAAFTELAYRWHTVEPRVVGDIAYASFQYSLDARMEERVIAVDGRGTAVLERMNGRWRIVHIHTSGGSR